MCSFKIYILHGEDNVRTFQNEGVVALKEGKPEDIQTSVHEISEFSANSLNQFVGSILEACSGNLDNLQLDESTYLELEPASKEDIMSETREVGMISAIITQNMFESIRTDLSMSCMDTYDFIAQAAMEFYKEFQGVTDWAAFCDSHQISDWEEFILIETKLKVTKRKF